MVSSLSSERPLSFPYVQLNHRRNIVAALREHLLESLRLRDGAWESVEDDTLVLLAERIVYAGEDADHQFVGDELTFVDVLLGSLAKFRFVLDFITQYVACGDMLQTVFLDNQIALCTFS